MEEGHHGEASALAEGLREVPEMGRRWVAVSNGEEDPEGIPLVGETGADEEMEAHCGEASARHQGGRERQAADRG